MQLSVEILSDRRWSYAYASTRRPIIKAISVTQSGQKLDRDYLVFPRVSFDFPLPEKVAEIWEGKKLPLEARGEKIGESIHWEKVPIKVNYPLLGRLHEKVSGLVVVEIVDSETGEIISRAEQQIELLAPNEWRHEPEFAEVFAAFVLPSDPFVSEILKEARSLLEKRTGSSSTQGYQSGPDRVHHIAQAVYDAMSSYKYAYSNPQGYFEMAQKIRTPSQIKSEHCGTCLDTAVLMAACFAQAGLEPVLFLTRGHAFTGYFTGRQLENELIGDEAVSFLMSKVGSVLVKQSDYAKIQALLLGNHIQPVETTTTTANFKTFHEACSEQNGFSIKNDADLESIVIISKAWQSGITPPVSLAEVPLHGFGLPSWVLHTLEQESSVSKDEQPDYELEDKSISPEERAIPPRVRQWMASLLNLGANNPLLKIKSKQMLEFDLPIGALGELDDLLYTPKKKIPIVSGSALPFEWSHSGVTLEEFTKWSKSRFCLVYPSYTKMNGIHRKAEDELKRVRAAGIGEHLSDAEIIKQAREFQITGLDSSLAKGLTNLNKKFNEVFLMTGNNSMYIALGTVSWSENTKSRGKSKPRDFCAPLYLYPVIVEGGKGSPFTIRLDPNGEVTPNYCLYEKLKRAPYNLDLQELINPEFEEKGIDFDKMFQIVEKRFKQARLDNFALQQRAVLGVFDYSTFRLWKDLKDYWKQMTEISPVVKHLVETSNVPFNGAPEPLNPKLEPHMPIAADDSQRLAVQWALDKKSFRLEGPPGTGKSQTISNLLASCIANNLKILFVAEKQTALNAVKDRLEANGLGRYTLNLHAKGDSDAKIRKNISDSLTTALNQKIDPEDQLWNDLTFRLKAEEEAIDRYKASLHDNGASGFSVWSANEELINIGNGDIYNLPPQFIDDFRTTWPVLRDVGVRLENALELVPNPLTHPWRFTDVKDLSSISLRSLTQVIDDLINLISNLDQIDKNLTDRLCSFDIEFLGALAQLTDLYTNQYLPSLSLLSVFSQKSTQSYHDKLTNSPTTNFMIDRFIDECRELAIDASKFTTFILEDFLYRDDLEIINKSLIEVDRILNGEQLASVADNWKSVEAEAANVEKYISIDLLGTKFVTKLDEAIARYESVTEPQKFEQLINNARAIQSKVSQHSPNISPEFLQRDDLFNVDVLLKDAIDAGILRRKKKSEALRELLGGHAIAKDDRLLFMSLKEMLVLAQESKKFCDEAVIAFGQNISKNFRPWMDADIDFAVLKFEEDRRKILEEVVNAKFDQKDEAEFVRSVKMLSVLGKNVEESRKLFLKYFANSYNESLRPWVAEDREALLSALTHQSMFKLRELLSQSLVSDSVSDVEVIWSVRGMLEIAKKSKNLCETLSTVILPGFRRSFQPFSNKDISEFVNAIGLLRHIGSVVSEEELGVAAEFIEVASSAETIQLLLKIKPTWSQFLEMLQLSSSHVKHWFGGRYLSQVVRAEFPELRRDAGVNDNFLELARWTTFANALSDLEELGLSEQALQISSLKKDINLILADIRRSVISGSLRARMQVGNLDRFDRKVHERRIATFEAALKETQAVLKRRIPGLVVQRRATRMLPTGKEGGATQDLLRGLKPSRGEKTPIRDLISKYGKALSDAMPCFLMSPDSVATLIPVGSIDFDLVIFDEASQVRTSHAVGALGRGKTGIVVGDSRQMPPSNTFSSNTGVFISGEDEDDDIEIEYPDEIEADESILDLAAKPVAARDAESILTEFEESKFPDLQLLCHYRSKDEVLISFSNTYIYEQPMLTFPSIKGEGSTALKFVHVKDGYFERDPKKPGYKFAGNVEVKSLRTNYKEAEQIVNEVFSRLRDPKRRSRREADRNKAAESIIIVTFNIQQLVLITEMFRANDSELFDNATRWTQSDDETETQYPPQLKVRNLENVQGDEAETVIFSVAFSKTSEGKFPLNWGPVTAIGGDRRLNVAVTRAQNEMIVFSSFLPDEMKLGGKTLSPNALMVYNFLRLAYEGPKKSGDLGIAVKSSPHIERIASSLRAIGFETQTQLGLSNLRVDIAVRQPGSNDWELAIMVDDTCWAERGSAFQRELLPKQVLPTLGWKKVMRIWLPTWLNNPDEVLAEVSLFFSGQFVEEPELKIELVVPRPERDGLDLKDRNFDSGIDLAPSPGSLFEAFTPFVIKPINKQNLIDEAKLDLDARQSINKLFDAILAAEAPVQSDRFAKIVCNSLGYSRVVPDRINQVLKLVPKKQIKKDFLGLFVWNSIDDPQNWFKYRTSIGEFVRNHEEISAQEYTNALIDIVKRAHSFGYEDAIKAVAEIFGFKRVTAAVRTSVELSFKKALKDNKIELIDGEFRSL